MWSTNGISRRYLLIASKLVLLSLLSAVLGNAADKMTVDQLTETATHSPSHIKDAIISSFQADDLKNGTAWIGHGPDFFFAIEASSTPTLFIDGVQGPQMQRAVASDIWYAAARIAKVGELHSFYYRINHSQFGGSTDLPAYGPLSYQQPGVPAGDLSQMMINTSRVYDGMKSDYWIYIPAQYDPKKPAALMVFLDGAGYIERNGNKILALSAIDNLIAARKIPVAIFLFINAGDISGSPGTPTYNSVSAYANKWERSMTVSMRSVEFDTVSDRFPRFITQEMLPAVYAKYNIRRDAYSHGIMGESSGGIAAFNTAWQMPDQFSRVISLIGSFTAIQWREDPGVLDGGQDYPTKVLREPKRNIRVFLQDGYNDMSDNIYAENYGNWPISNIQMANALKLKGYDFHFFFGNGSHNTAQGSVDFPTEMTWLWRDYDPAKTEQQYETESSEKSKAIFRVSIANRDVN